MAGFKKGLVAFTLISATLSFPHAVNATFSSPQGQTIAISAEAMEARKAYQARRADELLRLQTSLARQDNAVLTVVAAIQVSCNAACNTSL